MGRFYETEKSRFVDDFIYKPNFQLMANLAGNEQKDYDTNLANAELMKKIDIRYIEDPIERARVKAIQDSYGNKIDNLANGLRNSKSMNWRQEFMPGIEGLKRELKTDYDTGDIYKIQKSKDNYDAMMLANKAGIKDIQTREGANNYYMNKWKKNNNRSMDGIFEYKDSFDKRNISDEFLANMKANNVPIETQTAYTNAMNGYIYKGTDKTKIRTQETAMKLFDDFAEANQLKPYFAQRQEQLGENYLDEKGNLIPFSDSRSEMNKASLFTKKILEIKDSSQTKDQDFDQKYDNDINRAEKAAAAAKKQQDELDSIAIGTNKEDWFNLTADGQAVIKEMNQVLNAQIDGLSKITDPVKREEYIEMFKSKATPAVLQEIMKTEALYSKDKYDGERAYAYIYGKPMADAVKNTLNSPKVMGEYSTMPATINFGKASGKGLFSNASKNKISGTKNNQSGVKIENFVRDRINLNEGIVDKNNKPVPPFVVVKAFTKQNTASALFMGKGAVGATTITVFEDEDGNQKEYQTTYGTPILKVNVDTGRPVSIPK